MFEFVQIVDSIFGCGILVLAPVELLKGAAVADSSLPATPMHTPNRRKGSDRRYGHTVRLAAALRNEKRKGRKERDRSPLSF